MLCENGEYETAIILYNDLGQYKDSKEKLKNVEKQKKYDEAINNIERGLYYEALTILSDLQDFKDSKHYIEEYKENVCKELVHERKYGDCVELCEKLSVTNEYYYESLYNIGLTLYGSGHKVEAAEYFNKCIEQYSEAEGYIEEATYIEKYEKAVYEMKCGNADSAYDLFSEVPTDYRNTAELKERCLKYYGLTGDWNCYQYENSKGKIITDGGDIKYSLEITVFFYFLTGYDNEESFTIKEDGKDHYASYRMGGKYHGEPINMTISGGVVNWSGAYSSSYSFDSNTGILTYYFNNGTESKKWYFKRES